jgi:hypothetical protein
MRLLAARVHRKAQKGMEHVKSQFGPPRNAPFWGKNASKTAISAIIVPGMKEHSSKEVAAHETFSPFFRLRE